MKRVSVNKYRGSHEAVVEDGRLEIPMPYLRVLFERNKIGCQNSEAGAKRASLFLEADLRDTGQRRISVYDALQLDRFITHMKRYNQDVEQGIRSLLELKVNDGAVVLPKTFARQQHVWDTSVVMHPAHGGSYFYFHKA